MCLSGRLLAILVLLLATHALGEERARVVVATLDFPPYVSTALPENGVAWEIAREAFAQRGIDAELRIYPWARALRLAEQGEVDALYLANRTPERERWALFSDPVGEEVAVLWKRKERQLNHGRIDDLRGLRIGGLRDSAQLQFIARSGLPVAEISDLATGLRMLAADHLDVVIADRLAMVHAARNVTAEVWHRIDHMPQPVHVAAFHLAVARKRDNAAATVAAFNRGLKALRDSGRYQAIMKKHEPPAPASR